MNIVNDADNDLETNNSETNYSSSSRLFNTSKIHQFENFPEPRNATEEEQEAFHSKSYKFSIPQNINDFSNSSNQNYDNTSKSNSVSKVFNNLKINSKNDIFKEDAIKQKIKRQDRDVNDMQIEEFAFEQSVSQTDQITIIDNNNEEKGKSKRIYSIKLNINKANFQYIQRNYIADDDENDISNNPNLHSEGQDEFEIPEDGFE
ncbi:kinase-like domain-containing protein [Rhizophagus irregularis DAOM 181602=DAOM 197198]|nr:kinase-like domain-containing protein [Rhizophagus irregularis DAOM 181602=DAOM 197198]